MNDCAAIQLMVLAEAGMWHMRCEFTVRNLIRQRYLIWNNKKERVSFIFPCLVCLKALIKGTGLEAPNQKTMTLDCAKGGTQDLAFLFLLGTSCRFIFRMELEFCSVKIEAGSGLKTKVRRADA